MSRIENGKLAPRILEVSALIDLYGRFHPIADETRELVLRLAADARKEAWYSPFRDVLTGRTSADHVERYIEFETDAREIDLYQVEFVPGLLQTARYARAVADLFYPDLTQHERARFVEFRLARQDRLARGADPLRLRAAIRETAVRRILGPTPIMVEQLTRLAGDLGDGNPSVKLRIVPDALALPQAMRGSFLLMTFLSADRHGLAYIEGREGADYLQNEAATRRYSDDFDALWAAALSERDSLTLLHEAMRSLPG